MDRARLTISDVLLVVMAFFALAALYPVFLEQLVLHIDKLDRGTELLFLSILPISIIVIISVIFISATTGRS